MATNSHNNSINNNSSGNGGSDDDVVRSEYGEENDLVTSSVVDDGVGGRSIVDWMVSMARANTMEATTAVKTTSDGRTTTNDNNDDGKSATGLKQNCVAPDSGGCDIDNNDVDVEIRGRPRPCLARIDSVSLPVQICKRTVQTALEHCRRRCPRHGHQHGGDGGTFWQDLMAVLLAHYEQDRIILDDDAVDLVLQTCVQEESVDFFHYVLSANGSGNGSEKLMTFMEVLFDRLHVAPADDDNNNNNGANKRSNFPTFHRYLKFHVDFMLERFSSEGIGDDNEIFNLLFGKQLPETDHLTFSTQGSATNCVLYVLLEQSLSDRLPIRRESYSKCGQWKQYVRAAASSWEGHSGSSSPAIMNIGRPTMDDGVDAECVTAACVTSGKYPLYTAIRLGYTWSPVLQDLVQADPTVLESFDSLEVLPPFALAATVEEHEQILHPPPTMADIVLQQLLTPSYWGVTIADSNSTTVLETDITTHHNNDTKNPTCVTCGGHLFQLASSISKNGDANGDSSSNTPTPSMESDHLANEVVDDFMEDILSCVRDNDDNNDIGGGGGTIWHRLRRKQKRCMVLPESENVRWLDTIYHLLRADPTILDKITEMGRAELATLSLNERRG